jgi:1,4-dihydroxy-2-naphthoate octaprenyltransferase
MTQALRVLAHFRIPFALLLAPVFVLGAAFADAPVNAALLLVFFAFHLLLYGGTHAVNTWYDRDEGPVGGMYEPLPIPASLLAAGIGAKALGLLIVALYSFTAAVVYILYALLSLLYSHPAVRLKARPYAGAAVVMVGQGALPFLAAFLLSGAPLTLATVLALAGNMLLLLSLYPLSQSYQHEEDAARGDNTLSLTLGLRGTFRFAMLCFVPGVLLLAGGVALRFGTYWALPMLPAVVVLPLLLRDGGRRFPSMTLRARYTWLLRMNIANALAFGAYALALLLIA